MLPIVAIVGRPNVGKSTLFNRLLGQRRAIVDELSGLTRDRHYAEAEWSGRHFLLVDTGGIDPGSPHPIQRQVLSQTAQALEEADVALLVVDATQGIMPLDREVADRVRRRGRPMLVIANKADSAAREEDLADFYSLGIGDPIPVSALHGRGSGELLDEVIGCLPEPEETPEVEGAIRIAVVGRPNVGKSSLVNRLLGKERMVVDSVAGTTRDAVDTTFERGGRTYVLVDTAGLRRDRKVTDPVEYYSVTRALRAISRADLVILVIDVSREPSRQDAHLAALAEDQGKGIVVVFNKWDLVDDPVGVRQLIDEEFPRQYPFLGFVPRLYVSAESGKGVPRVLPACTEVYEEYARSIPTAELNRAVHEILGRVTPPATPSGRHLKLYYAAQTGSRPPTFSLFVNNPRYRQKNYVSYLERELRERFGFQGTPIVLEWKASH
ncbi:MAG: ribosome biogenesis GTPase Der [Candidatus Eisenbacteria bacterium]|uniref:GTPase Der n=1 Tax=Eiseniibacteriota bacterium TaxID=2212470 RepID=A0A538TN07_UNCEI|nr:MAG: ribosome biogenesis GTPase Der [Candidatus Eisenbacteria bacterium]